MSSDTMEENFAKAGQGQPSLITGPAHLSNRRSLISKMAKVRQQRSKQSPKMWKTLSLLWKMTKQIIRKMSRETDTLLGSIRLQTGLPKHYLCAN